MINYQGMCKNAHFSIPQQEYFIKIAVLHWTALTLVNHAVQ